MTNNVYLPIVVNNWLSRTFEDVVGLARPLWFDFSYWQRQVDAAIAIAAGCVGVVCRSSISTAYQDPYFNINYDAFKGLTYRTSYHVIYPDQSVTAQLDNWYKMHDEYEGFPRVIDLEVGRNQPANKIAAVTWMMSEEILRRDGHRPIIYSRKNLIDTWLSSWSDSMLNSHYYWLAQYLLAGYIEHAGPPELPNRVKEQRVLLHQTSDKKAPPSGMVASKSQDWNRWELGTYDDMNAFIDNEFGGGTSPPVPPPGEIEPIDVLRVTASALNMRAAQNASSTDIGTLLGGSDVPIVEYDGDWGKVEGWISTRYTNRT